MTMSGKVSVVDFIVFGVTLVVPVAIALYYSCVKKQKTTNAVFLADRSLSALPISFSLAVSYLSTVTITGNSVNDWSHDQVQQVMPFFRHSWRNCIPWVAFSLDMAISFDPVAHHRGQFVHPHFLQNEAHECLRGK